MTIGEQLRASFRPDAEAFAQLKVEVEEHLSHLSIEAADLRREGELDDESTCSFFRGKMRTENAILLLQYMSRFCEHVPTAEEIAREPVNPFAQFRDFVECQISQLREADVRSAALREFSALGLLNENNRWYYEGRIDELADTLMGRLSHVKKPDSAGYGALVTILQRISLFWFDIRRENIDRIRRSDLLIFRLGQYLRHRLVDQTSTHLDRAADIL